jgi:hypothetical protein
VLEDAPHGDISMAASSGWRSAVARSAPEVRKEREGGEAPTKLEERGKWHTEVALTVMGKLG